MPPAARRPRAVLAGALLAAGLVAGCSLPPPLARDTESLSPDATTAAPAPSVSPSLPKKGRPLTEVPAVRPAGFADPPPGAGSQRYRDQSLTWKRCSKGVVCASVLAPLDHAAPDGTAITLALAKRPATAERKLGTLFVNPGGPGGSGRQYAASFDVEGLEAYDVVGWDPRGVGASTPVRCYDKAAYDRFFSVDVSPDTQAEERGLTAETYAFA